MTKGERRKQRRIARQSGRPLTGELSLDKDTDPVEFSESTKGYRARERWARRYYELNGRPEGPWDV